VLFLAKLAKYRKAIKRRRGEEQWRLDADLFIAGITFGRVVEM
jgi:hypothetical protein